MTAQMWPRNEVLDNKTDVTTISASGVIQVGIFIVEILFLVSF